MTTTLLIGIAIIGAIIAAIAADILSSIAARRRQKWRKIADERRRKEELRIATYRREHARQLMDVS